ncbi:alanine dehydrogenase [Enterovibrio norvegicus]|uniref:Alanine dehydrogenase n=2 Tax=Enterovibrio norvegicus TaxID=188144 RepID=A0A1I5MSN9_9GAMM|nr:alanine dehydrogenase [Enterovibrio norvegicus]OEF52336.1 alanine dehydrogenase [Enterovibrio norvegicus]PML78902.1 alanine dehydrogenase [Enterovibrio norvegicus]PMN70864.1 alanine dehydrogenase [Enterovibrio norvegicus]PMN91040.1 alanine dehydrogenase [Enterovibrio norvegicus]SFP12578.1 alanine dehydrogenase [Enterovibrio norvegicus DSM 15893]
MIIGVPKEIKNHEYRVGMVPASVRELTSRGHSVNVQSQAGMGIGFSDDDYVQAGATILPTAEDVFAIAEMIVKVKEPQAVERAMLREGQILFTYLHLAPDFPQTQDLIKSKAVCIAYETVTDSKGRLPLLAPMSEVAGRMSIQAGAQALEKSRGGAGMLLGGVPGVEPAKIVVLGGGVVGSNAARMAVGMRADVTILDRNIDTLRALDEEFQGRAKVLYSTEEILEKHVLAADLVIGAVLIPGAAAPKLVNAGHIKRMKPGAAVVDVAIDQGGCFETSHATTHADPTYIVDDVVHYCVANMPGAVARTSTFALNNATLPYIVKLANQGYREALLTDDNLLNGLNVIDGKVTIKEVAESFDLEFVDPRAALA